MQVVVSFLCSYKALISPFHNYCCLWINSGKLCLIDGRLGGPLNYCNDYITNERLCVSKTVIDITFQPTWWVKCIKKILHIDHNIGLQSLQVDLEHAMLKVLPVQRSTQIVSDSEANYLIATACIEILLPDKCWIIFLNGFFIVSIIKWFLDIGIMHKMFFFI